MRVRMAVRSLETGGQPSRTEVQVLSRGRSYTLLECRPHTGRQHQIRVHLNAIGHPIVGDKLYPDENIFLRWVARGLADADTDSEDDTAPAAAGDLVGEGEPTKCRRRRRSPRCSLPRHALHAAGLIFPHPETGQPVEVQSELPPDLADFFAREG